MNVILVLVFFLSLMFLAMIFGERLSLFGFVDGRWLTAPFDMLARLWDMICEATDRIWCFIFDHFWWVAATASGSIGVLIVAFIMVSGLSNEAAAVRLEERTIMPVGSVLDHTDVLDPDNVVLVNHVATPSDLSHLVYQPQPLNRQPIVRDVRPRVDYVPPVPRYREREYSRNRLTLTMEPLARAAGDGGRVEIAGKPVRSQDFDRLIDRALSRLQNDVEWGMSSGNRLDSRTAVSRPPMVEDSEFAVGDLTSRVHVVAGDVVSSSNLRVEKFAPSNPGQGDFEIQIRLTNLSRERLSGVVLRELLPLPWVPKDMSPRGVFRDSTATWLVTDLGPLQDQLFTLQVESTENGRFQSVTEVSATSAVSNPATIARRTRPLPPVIPEPRTQQKLVEPKLRLILEAEPEEVAVGQWTTANFRLENVGEVPAIGVSLLITLAAGLDHHALSDDDLKREVTRGINRLDPGESRKMPLVVRPNIRGRHFATAELRLRQSQLAIKPFEVVGREVADSRPVPSPSPDFR